MQAALPVTELEENGNETIRILLADDHTVVRDGLRALLERESDMKVVAEAADGRESVTWRRRLRRSGVDGPGDAEDERYRGDPADFRRESAR